MARKPDIQYIRYYSAGSAARVTAPAATAKKKKATLPEPKKQRAPVLHIGPLAFVGLAMCVVMLVMMTVGMVQLQAAKDEADRLEAYVDQLAMEKGRLQAEFNEKCNLQEVETMALAMGMVPMDQVSRVSVSLPVEAQPQQEEGFWHSLTDLLH